MFGSHEGSVSNDSRNLGFNRSQNKVGVINSQFEDDLGGKRNIERALLKQATTVATGII